MAFEAKARKLEIITSKNPEVPIGSLREISNCLKIPIWSLRRVAKNVKILIKT